MHVDSIRDRGEEDRTRPAVGTLAPPTPVTTPTAHQGAAIRRAADTRRGLTRSALVIPVATLVVIAVGVAFMLNRFTRPLAPPLWRAGLVLLGGYVVWRTLAQAARGHFATDLVATLAVVTAVIIDQPLPGLIVVLMQTGGEALEAYARGRASRAVRALEEAAPRHAHRLTDDA